MRQLAVAATSAATLLVALLPAAPAAAVLSLKWTDGPNVTPPLGTTGAEWRDVSASGPKDVWAAGVRRTPADNPMTARWDGASWAIVPVPAAPAGQRYDLAAVDAVAPGDAWTVGSAGSATAALHYDGTAWKAVATPVLPTGQSGRLTGVDVSATGGWATGWTAATGKPAQPLVERWQKGSWSQVTVPTSDATTGELSAVRVRADNDVWAVGSQVVAGRQTGLILHWDGTGWQEQATPAAGEADEETFLVSVAATGPDDAWAAGRLCRTTELGESCRPLALHYTAGKWTVQPLGGAETELTEVVALAPDNVWVIGYASASATFETDYAEHWDGTVFTPDATVPNVPDDASTNAEMASALSAATAIPGTGGVWAVGWIRDPLRGDAHVVHRD